MKGEGLVRFRLYNNENLSDSIDDCKVRTGPMGRQQASDS
jgi:hypothetical protein